MEAMKQPTIRVVAVIAEGVPEADTKKLIAYARANNKILLGPATVGGVQVGTSWHGMIVLSMMLLNHLSLTLFVLEV